MNQETENLKNSENNAPVSERQTKMDGKQFLIIRHFVGDRDLTTLMVGLAADRANREMEHKVE